MKEEDFKIETYQELTLESLDKMMKKKCDEGKNSLNLNHSLTTPIADILRKKGFQITHARDFTSTIYW